MNVAVVLEPLGGPAPQVHYAWDTDTDVLTARVDPRGAGAGLSGSVQLEGADGSWVIIEVDSGDISGVEVAVWPDVRKRPALAPPAKIEEARVVIPARGAGDAISALEVETRMLAESDREERVIHFRMSDRHDVRAVRVARDLLLEVDAQRRIAGLWLLNVPPFPST